MLCEPSKIALSIRSVYAQEVALAAVAVNNDIVDNATFLGRDGAVQRLPVSQWLDVVARHVVEGYLRLGASDKNLAHVADVEEPRLLTHRNMLSDDAAVLNRHLPPSKRNDFSTKTDVMIIERRAPQRSV